MIQPGLPQTDHAPLFYRDARDTGGQQADCGKVRLRAHLLQEAWHCSPDHHQSPWDVSHRFMAFDRHMNMVLGDAEEFRRLPPKKGQEEVCAWPAWGCFHGGFWGCAGAEILSCFSWHTQKEERRVLGLLLLRGEEVVSVTIEGPPPSDNVRSDAAHTGPVGVTG